MVKRSKNGLCGVSTAPGAGCCRVESVVSVDERGQLVLPKEVREKAGIRAGDKLAVVSLEKDGSVCCLTLMRVEALTGMVKNILGPVMQEVMGK